MLDRTHCLSLYKLLSSVTLHSISFCSYIKKGCAQRAAERERGREVCVYIFLMSALPGISVS